MSRRDVLVKIFKTVPKPLVWKFAKKYIAGETLDDAVATVRKLNEMGASATMDVLGENLMTEKEVRDFADSYVTTIDRIAAEGIDSGISIKPTAMGLKFSEGLALEVVENVISHAQSKNLFVRIDMEDSPVTQQTYDLYRELRRRGYEQIGVVMQAYLRRTADDARALAAEGANVRLCKGIYIEPRRICYKDYQLVRDSFVDAMDALMRGPDTFTAVATHDDYLAFHGRRLVKELGLGPDRYEFQMLLGVDEMLRRTLIEEGHGMRVYVPFGAGWHGYSIRRLVENPKLASDVTKNVLGFGPAS
jgi:proline dehydrogenase